jgi:O-antigen ligase
MRPSARTAAVSERAAWVVAGALPLLLLHARYAPEATLALGSAEVDVTLADAAIAAVVAAAAWAWRSDPGRRALGARLPWAAAAALAGLALAGALWGPAVTDGYPFAESLVSALKFLEYALLAPAAAVLVRSRRDVQVVAWALALWAAAAALVALLQFVGLLGDLDDTPAWRRKPSFLGYHDFAALAGAALVLAVVLLAFERRSRLAAAAAAAGALGLALAGSVAAAGGVVVATLAVLAAAHRAGALARPRAALAAGLVAVAVAGTAAVRSGDVGDYLRFVDERRERSGEIETYSHRTVLAYIGVRIAADHPLLGTGWQGSALPASFEPYLDDARARYPTVSAESFPSEGRRWGVQNAYVQAAADLGLAGPALLLLTLGAGIAIGLGRAARGGTAPALGAALLLVAAAELAALGLVPGVPIWALAWLGLGLAVASAPVRERPT